MKKVCTVLIKIIAVVLLNLILPLVTKDAVLEKVVYAMEEVIDVEEAENTGSAIEELEKQDLSGSMDECANVWLSWSACEEELQYEIYKDDVLLVTVPGKGLSVMGYRDTETEAGAVHRYRIKGKSNDNRYVMITDEVSIQIPETLVISEDYSLTQDTTVYSVKHIDGVFYLNGFDLTVCKDYVATGGELRKANSQIDCKGDFEIDGYVIDTYYSDTIWYIAGDIKSNESNFDIKYGKLELKGSLAVTGGALRVETLTLCGEEKQEIKLGDNVLIDTLELENYSEEGVQFESGFSCRSFITNGCKYTYSGEGEIGYTLDSDMVIDGDYHLSAGALNLNGHKLEITGDLIQTGGMIYAHGTLIVGGDYYLYGDIDHSKERNSYDCEFRSDSESDYICVYGDVVLQNGYCRTLSKTHFEVWGNLSIYNCRNNLNSNSRCGFILSGSAKQTVRCGLLNEKDSLYFDVRNQSEEGVYFEQIYEAMYIDENGCKVSYINDNAVYDRTLTADEVWDGDFVMYGGELDLNGYTFTVTGDFIHVGGTVNVNSGVLVVKGDYRVQSIQQAGEEITYGYSMGRITAVGSVITYGDLIIQSRYFIGEWENGILECKGDIKFCENLRETLFGNMTVLLSGERVQEISRFDGLNTRISIKSLINRNKESVNLNVTLKMRGEIIDETLTFTENGRIVLNDYGVIVGDGISGNVSIEHYRGYALSTDLNVLGTITVSRTLTLNGYTLKAKNIILNGTLEFEGGSLIVDNQFTLKGKLIMNTEQDYLLCNGNCIMSSSQTQELSSGVIEFKGDVTRQKTSSGSYNNIQLLNTVIFSGDKKQTLDVGSSFYVGTFINRNKELLEFGSVAIHVKKDCLEEYPTISDNATVHISSFSQILNGSWSGNVSTGVKFILESDITIGGTLTISSYGGILGGYQLQANNIQMYGDVEFAGGSLISKGDLSARARFLFDANGGYVYVEKNLYLDCKKAYDDVSGAGPIEVKGNVKSTDESKRENGSAKITLGRNTLILSGTQTQTITGNFELGGIINRNTEELQILGRMYVSGICTDETETVRDDSRYSSWSGICITDTTYFTEGKWIGAIYILSKVTVKQDLFWKGFVLIEEGAGLYIDNHRVEMGRCCVLGEFCIENAGVYCEEYFYTSRSGKLIMQNENAYLFVDTIPDTDCYMALFSDVDQGEYLTAGVIEVKGTIGGNHDKKTNFGQVTLITSGIRQQWISTKIEVTDFINRNTEELVIQGGLYVTRKCIDETGKVGGSGALYLNNSVELENRYWCGNIAVDEELTLAEDLVVGKCLMIVDGGRLLLGDKTIEAESVRIENGILEVQNGELICEQNFVVLKDGTLVMQDEEGYLLVKNNFSTYSALDHASVLTDGKMEVKGDYYQKYGVAFRASGNHTVILDKVFVEGEERIPQKVSLDAPKEQTFNRLILKNAKKDYIFNAEIDVIANEVIVEYEVPVNSIEVGAITETTVKLTYEVPEDILILGYVIHRDGEKIGETTENGYTDYGLQPGTDYVYEVFPICEWGTPAKTSPKLAITTKTDTEPPVLQGTLKVELRTGSSITLSWNQAKDNVGVEGYTVYRDGVEIATGLTDTFYKDTTAEEKKAYRYSVTAYDGSGNISQESNQVESSLGKPEITALYPEPGKNIKAESLKLSVHFRDYGNSTGNQVKIEYKNSLGEWVPLTPQLLNQNRYNSTTLYVQYEWDVTHVVGVEGYTLRYTLYDADGNTDVEQVTYFVDHRSPATPTSVKAIADNGTVKISWEPSASEDCTEYRIYRKKAKEETFSLLATVKGQMNSFYTDKTVDAEEEYTYVVTAVDAYAYESESSEEVTVKADSDMLPPVVAEILPKAGRINRSICVSVEASDNREAASVVFYCRGEEEAEWTELGMVAIESGKAEYILDTTEYEDGVYYIGAEAIDAAGNRSEEIVTRRYQMDNTGISKIKIVECAKTSTQIQIKWEDVTETDFAYFRVEQWKGEEFVPVATVSDVLGYTVDNLSPEVTYRFRVVGYDTLGNRGEPSEECEVTTEKDTIKPSILGVYPVASYYKDSIALQVNARDNYALGKAVFSYSLNGVDFVELADVAASGEKQKYFSYDLLLRDFPEGSIFVRFEVYDSAGNKNALLENGEDVVVEYVIDRTAPSKVENLTTSATEGCVDLRWDSSVEQDVKYYRIYRADGPNGAFYLHKGECNTKNYYDTSVQAGACYRYKVSAVDIAGNEGDCSEEILVVVTADTKAPTVTGITPCDGKTVGKQVQIKALALDNASLAWVKAEYQKDGEGVWNLAAEVQATGKSSMACLNWNTEALTEGSYRLRITACDIAGNTGTEQIVTCYVDHTAPEVPQLSAETGHFEIKLTIAGEKSSDFAYYEIYRREVGSGLYTQIATVTENCFIDTAVIPGDIYFYQVAVYDNCGNVAWTEAVEGYADDTDVVAPVAVLPENLVGLTGMEIAFDGMGCTDNVRIMQYLWNMGDGTELEGAQPVHSYQEAGTYEVTLQVKDAAGNEAQATTTVTVHEKTGRGSSVVKVVDENGAAIPYASIFVSTPVTEGYSLKADSRGLVTVVAENGTYNVAAYASGYLPEDIDISVSEYEVREYTLCLVKDELIVGELTVRRMELEEMLEAGVDFSDPENYNLFVFKVTLTFAQTPIPVEINYVSGSGGTSYTFSYEGGEQGGSGERTVYIQEITQTEEEDEVPILAYVSTTQHVSWLKDMYEVELGILNAADSRYTIEDAVATLNLPESGVSLAKLVGGQSLTQEMGTIRGQERKTVSWVVKGDRSGSYSLSADFEGTLMPFRKKVTARFETENEFEVTTGEGLHIYVMPEKSAYIGEEYYIQFKIVNESEEPFYHFGTSIGAYKEPQKEYTVTDEDTGEVYTTTSAPIAVTKGSNLHQAVILEDGQKVVISALLPGETFYGTYKTTFTGEGDPETVYYRLVDSLVEVLSGANLGVKVTVIPIEGHIYRTRFRTEVLPSYYGDPVDITSGYFTDEVEVFAVKGATTIGLDMHYSSGLSEYRGELGYGWYHDYEMYLEEENGIIWYYGSPDAKVSFLNKNALQNKLYATKEDDAIRLAEGEEYSFGEYCSLSETMEGYRIIKHKDSTYTMTLPNGICYGFDAEGRLIKVTDTDGKSVSVSYTDGTMILRDDLSGKQVYYNYNSLGFLASVTDDNGRECVLTYDIRGCLTSYTDPIGNKITYCYDGNRRVVEAGNAKGTFVVNVYDEEGRVTEQTDARGGKIAFSYESTAYGMLVTIVDAAGVKKQAAIDANGRMLYVVNENGGKTTYAYDKDGNLLNETDSYGNTTFREYDEKGNVVKLTDCDNRTTTMTYDANGNLEKVIDADGNTSSYTYDKRGLMLSATDYNGRVTTYEYDAAGFLVKETVEGLGSVCYTYENGMQSSVTDYMGNTSYMEYDGMGNLVESTDADGNVTFYEFNAAGQMERSVDNQGNVTSYRYDCNSNLIRLTDGAGNTTVYEYDAAGNQTAINYPDGTKTAYTYDSMGRCIEVCYADGTKECKEYDVSGNLTKQIWPDGSTVSYKYDLLNRCVEEQDGNGNCVSYEYYPNGKLYKTSYPDGSSLLYTYNSSGKPVTVTDHTGVSVSYEYDVKGNVIAEWDALGNTKGYSYDVYGRLTEEIDANGNKTTYEYDANSNCIKKTNALGVSVHMRYDKRNRLTEAYTETKDGEVYKVSYEYDSLGRVVAVTDEEGNTSRMTYDTLGNVTAVTDARGQVRTVTTYDCMGRTATVQDALGITVEYSYDTVGNLLRATELLNGQADRVTAYEYDSLGRLVGVTDPLDGVTEEVYNKVGQLVSRTDANGGTTTYTYDCMGRLLTELNPIGSKTSYAYNAQGLLSELTNARGQKTAYAYDAAGRVTSLTDELGTVSYEYDANGNVLKVTDEGGSIERKYDALNRVTEYTDYNGNTVKYAYDEIGNLISLTYPGGEIVRYTYYKNGWLQTVTDNEGRVTSYEYDANGNLTHTTRANGTEEFCTYNEAGLLVEQKDVKGEEVLTHYTYTYDERGNIATVEGTETTEGDLTRLISATMTYDAANRLLTYNGEALRYDADGNMTYGPVNGEMTELVYDCRNRLVSAGGVTYTYDPENTRIAAVTESYKEVYVTESVTSSLSRILSATRYEKTAEDKVELENSETKLGEAKTTLYVYGNGLIYEYADDTVLYHHYNNLGSTVKLTNEDGQVIETYTYGVYGELLGGDTSLTRFLYNGRCGVSTDDNGLYYMRQRYYNPEIKRFVNQDILTGSIGNSQSLNRYSYVQGNPVSYTDPFGLSPLNGLFSGTMLIHTVCGLLGWIPGPVGAIANAVDGLVYLFVDKDYKNAFYSLGTAVTFGAGKIVAAVGKGSKTALNIQRGCNAIGNGINFAQSAEGTYQTASMMVDKYIVQGQPLSGSTVLEFALLGANMFGAYKSGTYVGNDIADFGGYLKRSWTAKGTGSDSNKVLWGNWEDYKHVTIGDNEYAEVGERLYTRHAVARMQPSGMRYTNASAGGKVKASRIISAGELDYGRSVSPNYIEDIISMGKVTPQVVDGVPRTVFSSGSVDVITEQDGRMIVTILTH